MGSTDLSLRGIGLCACKWSAKANIPVFPPEGVSLLSTIIKFHI